MDWLCKYLSICLVIILAVSSLIAIEFAEAQTPSTPTFKVKLISGYNEVPTTYSTDPYTGEQ